MTDQPKRLVAFPLSTILAYMFCFVALYAGAQIPDVEVQIVNPLKVTLPLAERNFEKIPVRPPEPVYPPVVYEFLPLQYQTPWYTPVVRPLKLKSPEKEIVSRGYLTLGYGNYGSPYADGFLPLVKDLKGKSSAGLRLFHNSFASGAVDGKNSGSGVTTGSADFSSSGQLVTVEGLLNYRRNATGFYGYDRGLEVKRDTISQIYNTVALSLRFSNTKKSDFNYRLGAGFSHLWNKLKAAETDVSVDFKSSLTLNEKSALQLNAQYSILSREDVQVEPAPRHLFKSDLLFAFEPVEKLDLQAGLRVAFENDTLVKDNAHVFPVVQAVYQIAPKVTARAAISGDVEKNSLHTISAENLWVNSNLPLAHNLNTLDVEGSIRAGFGSGFSATGGFDFSNYSSLYFYVNAASDKSRFDLNYDAARRTDLYTALAFQRGKSGFDLRADYFLWTVTDLAAAFHRPKLKFEFNGSFTLFDRLLFRPYVVVLSGIQAPSDVPNEVVTLPAATDLGLKMDYNFSERGSIMIRLTNLLSNEYAIYQNYPVRGFQALGGITWKF